MQDGTVLVIKAGPAFEQVASNRMWSEDEDRELETPSGTTTTYPPRDRPSGPPPLTSDGRPNFDKMDQETLYKMFSYFDPVIYGAAAVDGDLVVRTGQELYCVRKEPE